MEMLLLLLLAAIGAGSLWAWSAVVQRIRGRQPLLEFTSRDAGPHGLFDLLLTFLLWTAGQVVAARVLASVYGVQSGTELEQLPTEAQAAVLVAGSMATIAALVVSAIWLGLRYHLTKGALPNANLIALDLRLGSIAFLLLSPVVYGIQLVLSQWFKSAHPLIELLQENPSLPFLLVAGFAALIVAPIGEEYFFRFMLQGWFERVAEERRLSDSLLWGARRVTADVNSQQEPSPLSSDTAVAPATEEGDSDLRLPSMPGLPRGEALLDSGNPYSPPTLEPEIARLHSSSQARVPFWPVLVSSALFALVHYSHGPAPIPLFVFALGLGYLYQRTHRLLPCIVLHFSLNACSLLMFLLSL